MFLAAACGASQSKTSQHTPAQPQASQPAANPCTPGACGVTVTTSGGESSPASRDNPLRAWGAAHLATLKALSDQATQLGRGAGTAEQLKSGCSQLGSAIQAALTISPPPDPSAASHLANGLSQLQAFTRDCPAAFSGDTAAGSRLVLEETQGTSQIDMAIQAVTAGAASRP
jgi:hypothetical protein